jgi:uncharacterized protein YraI
MSFFMIILVSLILAFAPAVLAQTDCPAIVQTALHTVDDACSTTGRNQVCYGNIFLKATPQDGTTLAFEKSGDIADVAGLKALQLSSMSLTDKSWGVALMKLQANLPNTVPGQNVTVLLFGNVEIDSNTVSTAEIDMTAQRGVNVRQRPNTQASVLTSLKPGQSVAANGRLKDGSWIRIRLDNGAGWVAADFLKTGEDMNRLPVVEPGQAAFGPMQSFYFRSGSGDRPCAEAPDSGILIQTPKGAAHVTFQINDVAITLGSTVYLQAQRNSAMTVTVVEGQATVTAQGGTMLVPAGSYSTVQLNADGHASGKPQLPKPYDLKPLQTLPLGVKAFDKVTVARPLTPAQITAALTPPTAAPPSANAETMAQGGEPGSGQWSQTHTITVNTCHPEEPGNAVGTTSRARITLTFSANRDTVVWSGWPGAENANLPRVSDNTYRGGFGDPRLTITLTFTSATTYNFYWRGDFPAGGGFAACQYYMDGSGVFQG